MTHHEDEHEVKEAAEAVGVKETDGKSPDQLKDEAEHAQEDSVSSPSTTKAEDAD